MKSSTKLRISCISQKDGKKVKQLSRKLQTCITFFAFVLTPARECMWVQWGCVWVHVGACECNGSACQCRRQRTWTDVVACVRWAVMWTTFCKRHATWWWLSTFVCADLRSSQVLQISCTTARLFPEKGDWTECSAQEDETGGADKETGILMVILKIQDASWQICFNWNLVW